MVKWVAQTIQSFSFFFRNIFYHKDVNVSKYTYFSDHERLHYKEEAKKMFYYGYDNYMAHAFPEDELNPIYCRGRGPDYLNPSNININDVLGKVSLFFVLNCCLFLNCGSLRRRQYCCQHRIFFPLSMMTPLRKLLPYSRRFIVYAGHHWKPQWI